MVLSRMTFTLALKNIIYRLSTRRKSKLTMESKFPNVKQNKVQDRPVAVRQVKLFPLMPELSLSWSFVGMWCVCVLLNENKKTKGKASFSLPPLYRVIPQLQYILHYSTHFIWTSAMQSMESCLQKVQIPHSKWWISSHTLVCLIIDRS